MADRARRDRVQRPAADVRRVVAAYAHSSPAVIRCGRGVERNRNGGNAVRAIQMLEVAVPRLDELLGLGALAP